MNRIITDNIDEIKILCSKFGVKNLYAFGSVCTDKFSDTSDIDLLVSFQPMEYGEYADTYFAVADRLEQLFSRPVDLVTEKSLNNPFFIESLNQTKTLIYGE
jgi:predicted nucleotidyltransferase